jgi:hypothetical protein
MSNSNFPDWLKNFADNELKRGTSPFSEIQNIFKENKDLDAVEAKVNELRKRIGLDKVAKDEKVKGGFGDGHNDKEYDKEQLEKGKKIELEHTNDPEIATEIVKDHLQESKDFKGEEGGKYYNKLEKLEEEIKDELLDPVKKAEVISNLIRLANHFDSVGKIGLAMTIDMKIKKLADEKLDRLPILPMEMWDDEQINQALKQPELFQKQPERLEEFKKEVEKRMKRKGLDVGEWREHGFWGLWLNGFLLGFATDKSNAELIKQRLANMFAEGNLGEAEFINKLLMDLVPYILSQKVLDSLSYKALEKQRENVEMDSVEYMDKLLKNPNFKNDRRKFLQDAVTINKAPQGFDASKQSTIRGGLPTEENISSSNVFDIYPEIEEVFEGQMHSSKDKFYDAADKFLEKHVQQEARKLEGFDPSKMADDGLKLSCRHIKIRAEEELKVFKKYPNVKKHIDNICKSRQGFINIPALIELIESRAEKFTYEEIKEIKEYAKKKLEEEKAEVKNQNDDDLIGLGNETSDSSDKNDANNRVFSEPPKF